MSLGPSWPLTFRLWLLCATLYLAPDLFEKALETGVMPTTGGA